MVRYGDLSGDPTDYNPQRSDGNVTTTGADIPDLLDGIAHEDDEDELFYVSTAAIRPRSVRKHPV